MRVFAVASIIILSVAQAQSQDQKLESRPGFCSYTRIDGQTVNVPVGVRICRRTPGPFEDQFTLLSCDPPLNEVELVKRGDPRCDRYEERQ
jgi:hypothetical protein